MADQPLRSAAPRALLLFDIDGVIRDVAGSYRRAIVETVHHYCGWRPEPGCIDALKGEGRWNNDWEASLELLRRRSLEQPLSLPPFEALVATFGGFYFGGDPDGDPVLWQGFIGREPLLVQPEFFAALTAAGIAWGFVSGAEPPSARFVLERRLGLADPPLIAMGDAPDKPDPTGLLRLVDRLLGAHGGNDDPGDWGGRQMPIAYLGDTVADVQTVLEARQQRPDLCLVSLAVAPPHLHAPDQRDARSAYELRLRDAGADHILAATGDALALLSAPWPPAP